MKTQDLATTLRTFAALASDVRAGELVALAEFIGSGKDETISARVKRLGSVQAHPGSLRSSVGTIEAGLRAAGASKQAAALNTLGGMFTGPPTASLSEFIDSISAGPPPKVARAKKPSLGPDLTLARDLADELTRTIIDANAFANVFQKLKIAKLVSTPTLAVTANRFLGNSVPYKGRKAALADIEQRQKLDAREYARGQALRRVSV